MNLDVIQNEKGSVPIREKRETLGLPKLDVDLLYAQTGSADPLVHEQAKRTLRLKWELTPEQDSRNARSESIIERINRFSEDDRKKIVSLITDLQLTQDCNGNCFGCPNGKDKGVSAKFSFASLREFFQTYGDDLSDHFMLFWQNDPFDYRDGTHSFSDVYSAFREVRPDQFLYISTAMPRGSSEDFITFMRTLAQEKKSRSIEHRSAPTKLRISVWKHNIQRIEAVIEKCIQDLSTEGYEDIAIAKLFADHVSFESRFDDAIQHIGPLIQKADGISRADSIACQDAFVMTPDSQYAVIMTTPTPYDPMGEINIPIDGTSSLHSIPMYIHKSAYSYVSRFFTDSLPSPFLPTPESAKATLVELQDPTEDVCMRLGRSVQSIWLVMNNLETLPNISKMPESISIPLSDAQIQYISSVFEQYNDVRKNIVQQIERSKSLALDQVGMREQRLQYYALLSDVYMSKMDYLDRLFRDGIPLEIVGAVSGLLNHIGRREIGDFSRLMGHLDVLHSQLLEKTIHDDDDIGNRLFTLLSPVFNFSDTSKPQWFINMCQLYGGWAYETNHES